MRLGTPAITMLALATLLLPSPGYAEVLLGKTKPFSSSDSQPDASSADSRGLPIFRFNENSWLELAIPETKHPETGREVEAERNRENANQNSDRPPLFDESLDFLNDLQLRYRIKFK